MKQLFISCLAISLVFTYGNSVASQNQRLVRANIASNQPKIIAPKSNAATSSPLTVEGTGIKNRKVEVNVIAKYADGEQDLGTFTATVNASGTWSTTPINLWLPENAKNAKYVITAIDAVDGKESAAGTVTVFPPRDVRLIARKDLELVRPEKTALTAMTIRPEMIANLALDPAPKITSPASQAQVNSPVVVKGTAEKNAPLEIRVKAKFTGGEQDLGMFRAKANAGGTWETTPIHLWVPGDAKNVSYEISAVQFNENSSRSRMESVTIKPAGMVMALAPLRPVVAVMQPAATAIPAKPLPKTDPTKPAAPPAPVEKPLIISPQTGEVIGDGKGIQFLGKGTAGHSVKVDVRLQYLQFGSRKSKLYHLSAKVDANDIWRTDKTTFNVPEGAYDIQYTVKAEQTSPAGRTSRPESATFKQQVAAPEIKGLDYYHPSSTSSRDVLVAMGILDRNKDQVNVSGTGGPGLKIRCELRMIYDGKDVGGRYGDVIVDSKGKWLWKTGWLSSSRSKYEFVITAVQMSPGYNEDKSEPVTKRYKKGG